MPRDRGARGQAMTLRDVLRRAGFTGVLVRAAVAASMCGWPSPARAQQGWSQPVSTISQPEAPTGWVYRDLATDSAGNVLVIWPQTVGSDRLIQAAHFTTATDSWSAPVTLSRAGHQANYPQIAADSDGNAIAVWQSWDGRDVRILAAHFAATTGEWSTPRNVSPEGQDSMTPQVAVDAEGSALVMWNHQIAPERFLLQSVRYTSATASWSGVVDVPGSVSDRPGGGLQMNRAGATFVVFDAFSTVYAARYSMAANTWSGPFAISAPREIAYAPALAVDPAGNALVVFLRTGEVVQTVRFAASTGVWTAPTVISLAGSSQPSVVVDGAGNGTALWHRVDGTEVARYSFASNTWSSATTIVTERACRFAALAADDGGNVLVVWSRQEASSCGRLQAARNAVGTGDWTITPDLSAPGQNSGQVQVAFDRGGNATVIWEQSAPTVGLRAVQARRWVARPTASEIRSVSARPGALEVGIVPPVTHEPAFSPINYAYSIDDGVTWITRVPASTSSPIVIGGLTNFLRYPVRVRAINVAGPGVASAVVTAIPGPGSGAPEALTATRVAGDSVTLSWTPPTAGAVPTGYVLEGGVSPGDVLASIPTGSVAPTFTFVAPTGAFYIRIHAVSGALRSGPSNEIRIFVNVSAAPSAPTGLLGLVNGAHIALSWTNTFAGGVPTSLWLNVTGAITTTLPLLMGEVFSYANVPPGTYTLSVRASNASGLSPPSNSVTLTFPQPCTGVPFAPEHLQAWTVGRTIFLAWQPPVGGTAVTSYTVWVSGAYVGSFATVGRTLSGAAAPGSYVLSVTAQNACGAGPSTPAQTVVIPQ